MKDFIYDFMISKIGSRKDQVFAINIIYIINRILFPPAKVVFSIWFFVWLFIAGSICPVDIATNTVTVTWEVLSILPLGYLIMCGIADLIYFSNKERYQIYKEKVIEKRDKRLRLLEMQYANYGTLSATKIQRRYGVEFYRANEIMQYLEQLGFVGSQNGYNPRILLCEENIIWDYLECNVPDCRPLQDTTQTVNAQNYDNMEGHQFEYFCADILKNNGFENVEVTQGSGDHGIDILAEKDGITYAIQCKCYSSNIGNAAVQQAHTGKSLYHKDIAVVLTNRYFTTQAKEEAGQLGVKLWDRDKLNEMIEKCG